MYDYQAQGPTSSISSSGAKTIPHGMRKVPCCNCASSEHTVYECDKPTLEQITHSKFRLFNVTTFIEKTFIENDDVYRETLMCKCSNVNSSAFVYIRYKAR